MARDYTKYNVQGLGENLNKRKLVFSIVKDWIEKNNPTFETLQMAFPDEVQGGKGFIRKEKEVCDPQRFNMREPLKIKNGAHIVVSNQWGENIPNFIEISIKLGYQITTNEVIVENINSQQELDLAIRISSTEEYGNIINGTFYMSITVDTIPVQKLQENFNLQNLAALINEILWNEESTHLILETAIMQLGLEEMSSPDFDWFNHAPKIEITEVFDINIENVYNTEEWDINHEELKTIFEENSNEASDDSDFNDMIDEFLVNTITTIDEDVFSSIYQNISDH